MRAGRIIASRMKACCKTNSAMPAQSLVKSICYPMAYKFISTATQWGCKHEKTARDQYKAIMQENHNDISVHDSGLVINPKWPHLGASPDGIVDCACCEFEISKPRSARTISPGSNLFKIPQCSVKLLITYSPTPSIRNI